jgi:CRP-like cAMP-binding protein
MAERQFTKGEVVFREGDQGEAFYRIKSGIVGIYAGYGDKEETKIRELKDGEYFGEMAVMEVYPRSATAVALSDSLVADEIPADSAMEYFREQPDQLIDVLKLLSSRLREVTKDYIQAGQAIEEIITGNADQSEGFSDKIKKFADVYFRRRKAADRLTAEEIRVKKGSDHTEGYYEHIEKYDKGTIIFRADDPGNCMYDVHGGRVGIFYEYGTDNEKQIAEIYANQFFGEMGLIEKAPRSATAVVLENDTIVEIIYEKDLLTLLEKNPGKIGMILDLLSQRLRHTTKDYFEACMLLAEIKKVKESGASEAEIKKKADDFRKDKDMTIALQCLK